jgi:heme oxygenase
MQGSMHDRAVDRAGTEHGQQSPRSDPDVEERIARLPRALIRQRMSGLRRQTAPAHARLDNQIEASGWLRSAEGYREMLGRFYGYYRPLEAVLRDAVTRFDLAIDLDARAKSHLIARDLAALGLSAERLHAIPLARTMPGIESREAALGCLYVVEGATLGGQVLTRRLHQQFGTPVESAVAFFSSYGADVGQRWIAFCSLLAEALATQEAERVVVSSAATMFSGFGHWLEKGDAPT